MRYLCLNPRALTCGAKVHDYFARQLNLPAWYGRNLDALHDVLSTHFEPLSILCLRYEAEGALLYPHLEPFIRVALDAARENKHLRVDVQTLPAPGINEILFGPP